MLRTYLPTYTVIHAFYVMCSLLLAHKYYLFITVKAINVNINDMKTEQAMYMNFYKIDIEFYNVNLLLHMHKIRNTKRSAYTFKCKRSSDFLYKINFLCFSLNNGINDFSKFRMLLM